MADYADQSDHKIEAEVADGIAKIRAGLTGPFAELPITGYCHWCHEPVGRGQKHCSPAVDSCAEDHAKYITFNQGARQHG